MEDEAKGRKANETYFKYVEVLFSPSTKSSAKITHSRLGRLLRWSSRP